ncbi:MAG: hypothetical protein JNM00_13670, partial [Flavobacteriales bacterium]|nr:hypothetical protein [Flavobacteriales bacterium]
MRKWIQLLAIFVGTNSALAQVPNQFNYQAVLRDSNGEVLSNTSVGVRFTIQTWQYEEELSLINLYQETKTLVTNDYGLINSRIGSGPVTEGSMADIDWKADSHFLLVEVDMGSGYVELSLQELVSVPYAITAQEAINNWSTSGNSFMFSVEPYIGTNNDYPLRFRSNNVQSGLIDREAQNVFFGYNTGPTNTGEENTFLGHYSGSANTIGEGNSAFGAFSLISNTSGSYNTSGGSYSFTNNLTGSLNTAYGYSALQYNTSGSNNVALGISTLELNKSGSNATAVGAYAMANSNNTSIPFVNRNVAVGFEALMGSNLPQNNTGNYNTAIGYTSLRSNSSGENNTGCGYLTLSENISGASNSAFGYAALYDLTTGEGNSAFGRSAYYDIPTLSNTTCIGRSSGGVVDASNRVEIGNTSVSVIAGQVSWSTYSDARIKDDVEENVPGLSFITKLRPVTYHLNIHRQNEMVYANKEKDAEMWEGKYD